MGFILIYLKHTIIPLYYPGRIAERMVSPPSPMQKAPAIQVFFFCLMSGAFLIPSSESQKSRKLPKSQKSQESLAFLRVAKVGKLLDSRRVGQVSLFDVLCIVFRVGTGVRCNHMFLLVGVTKVVFAEKDT